MAMCRATSGWRYCSLQPLSEARLPRCEGGERRRRRRRFAALTVDSGFLAFGRQRERQRGGEREEGRQDGRRMATVQCSKCTAERRGFRRELDSWRHKLIHCVGMVHLVFICFLHCFLSKLFMYCARELTASLRLANNSWC